MGGPVSSIFPPASSHGLNSKTQPHNPHHHRRRSTRGKLSPSAYEQDNVADERPPSSSTTTTASTVGGRDRRISIPTRTTTLANANDGGAIIEGNARCGPQAAAPTNDAPTFGAVFPRQTLGRTSYSFVCCSMSALNEQDVENREDGEVGTRNLFWHTSPANSKNKGGPRQSQATPQEVGCYGEATTGDEVAADEAAPLGGVRETTTGEPFMGLAVPRSVPASRSALSGLLQSSTDAFADDVATRWDHLPENVRQQLLSIVLSPELEEEEVDDDDEDEEPFYAPFYTDGTPDFFGPSDQNLEATTESHIPTPKASGRRYSTSSGANGLVLTASEGQLERFPSTMETRRVFSEPGGADMMKQGEVRDLRKAQQAKSAQEATRVVSGSRRPVAELAAQFEGLSPPHHIEANPNKFPNKAAQAWTMGGLGTAGWGTSAMSLDSTPPPETRFSSQGTIRTAAAYSGPLPVRADDIGEVVSPRMARARHLSQEHKIRAVRSALSAAAADQQMQNAQARGVHSHGAPRGAVAGGRASSMKYLVGPKTLMSDVFSGHGPAQSAAPAFPSRMPSVSEPEQLAASSADQQRPAPPSSRPESEVGGSRAFHGVTTEGHSSPSEDGSDGRGRFMSRSTNTFAPKSMNDIVAEPFEGVPNARSFKSI